MTVTAEARTTLCEINVKVLRLSERAALVTPAFRAGPAIWLPLAHVELAANEDVSGTYRLTCPEWLAKRRGLV